MATWPTPEEFAAWAGPPNTVSPTDERVIEGVAAANAELQDQLDPTLVPDPNVIASTVRLAALILASRYYRRPDSPLGKVGAQEFMVDIGRSDPDVRRLISQWVTPDGADVTVDTVDSPT